MLNYEKNEENRENHQIPYDYTVEKTNGFKGFDMTECLKNYGQRFMIFYRRQ